LDRKFDIQIIVKNNLPPDLSILTDAFRLKQILVNLMSNAMKFTESGSIKIGSHINDSGEIRFYVEDTGIGIEDKNLNIIFDAFKQADENIAIIYGGTGLGLTISKNLVSLLGGHIGVQSKYQEGSTFFFTIPYNPVAIKQTKKLVLSNSNIKRPDLKQIRDLTILIAEDDDSNFIYLRDYLSRYNFRIIRAKNGLEACEICKKTTVNLVFMDMHMPIMSGYESTRIIKSLWPTLPVIAQTAYVLSGEKEKCMDAGCDEYVGKPLNFNDINSILTNYLMLVSIN
jgi:CheY-like chemotaxis protein